MKRLLLVLLLVAPLGAQEAGGGGGTDLARLFPADTFLYVEADFGALKECLPEWQVGKIVTDPALKVFLKPALARLGVDPEKPLETMHGQVPGLLEGKGAVGVRGVSLAVRDDTGREWHYHVSPDAPFDAAAMFRYFGMMAALEDKGAAKVTFDIDVDFLAVGKPGPLGKQLLGQALDALEGNVTRTAVKVGGLDGTHVRSQVDGDWGMSYAFNFYAVEQAGQWLLATHKGTLEQALAGGPRAPLAATAALAEARRRFTGGRPLLLGHVDLGLLAGAWKAFVPPIAHEMGEALGVNSIRGLGLGISLVDGGVRESIGIVLDGKPRGAWKLLDAMPGGLRSLEVAPPGALAAFGVKLDPTLLRDRLRALCAETLPGNEDAIEGEIARELAGAGFDLKADLLAALGDEAAVIVYPAGMNAILPRFVVGVDGRDEAALARLVGKVQAQIPADVAQFTPVDLEGTKAVRVASRAGYDLHFAVHKRHLFLASDAPLLREALGQWGAEGRPTLLRDDPVLPLVLKATNGGDAGSIAALGYVNLRGCATEALKTLPMWGAAIPADWFDGTGVGGLARIPNHLTGAAIALRHDKDGIVLDCYSPVAVLIPCVILAMPRQPVRAQAVAAPPRGTGKPSLGIPHWSRDGESVKVLGLAPDGPAAAAGFRQGDRIVGIESVAVKSFEDLLAELAKHEPGDAVEVKILRGDKEMTLVVELGEEEIER